MEIKCEYCGSMIPDNAEKCPNCGATNANMKRMVDTTPKTIEELKEWYAARNLPPYETTRFFIGINYKEPKAFGIYEENGEFIVYKNKDTGERAVRYRGTDEAYAVNELFLKLKSEILNQKANQQKNGNAAGASSKLKFTDFLRGIGAMFGAIVALFLMAATAEDYPGLIKSVFVAFLVGGALVLLGRCLFASNNKKQIGVEKKRKLWLLLIWVLVSVMLYFPIKSYNTAHYYSFDNHVYCEYQNDWYEYDYDYGDYYSVNKDYLPVEVYNNPADYEYNYNGYAWDSDYTFPQFQDSTYYNDNISWTSSSSSSDSDYDWDSGDSWSSDSTDWGSDW